jgi:hypothetical protein
MRVMRVLCLASVIIASVAASSAQAATPPLTVSQYRTQANALCAAGAKAALPTGSPVVVWTAALHLLRADWTAVGDLRPPTSLASLRAQILAVGKNEVTWFSSEVAKLRAGTITNTVFETQLNAQPYGTEEDALWARIGATVCAKP